MTISYNDLGGRLNFLGRYMTILTPAWHKTTDGCHVRTFWSHFCHWHSLLNPSSTWNVMSESWLKKMIWQIALNKHIKPCTWAMGRKIIDNLFINFILTIRLYIMWCRCIYMDLFPLTLRHFWLKQHVLELNISMTSFNVPDLSCQKNHSKMSCLR